MSEIVIRRRVPMESQFLHKGIRKHLLKKITNICDGECSLKYGYILEVTGLTKIISSIVAPGTIENIFEVEFTALAVKPVPGLVITGEVTIVCADGDGVFINVSNKFLVMLSVDEFDKFGYQETDDGYIKNGVRVQVGSYLTAKITQVRYECSKKLFTTIGTLVLEE